MFSKLERLFAGFNERNGVTESECSTALAVAVLMVESALTDGLFDDNEKAKSAALLGRRFDLTAEETDALLAKAQARAENSAELFGFTRQIKDNFSEDERIELMEMLWELAYVDGVLNDLEASMMRRLAGLLYVSDRDNGKARKRALARLQTSPEP